MLVSGCQKQRTEESVHGRKKPTCEGTTMSGVCSKEECVRAPVSYSASFNHDCAQSHISVPLSSFPKFHSWIRQAQICLKLICLKLKKIKPLKKQKKKTKKISRMLVIILDWRIHKQQSACVYVCVLCACVYLFANCIIVSYDMH